MNDNNPYKEDMESLYEIIHLRVRNITSPKNSTLIENDYFIIDAENEIVFHKKTKTNLKIKGKKFEVLLHLMRHEDQIVSREQLLDAIWDEPELVVPQVVDKAISSLRKIFDNVGCRKTFIATIRRRGFIFNSDNLEIYEKRVEEEMKQIQEIKDKKIAEEKLIKKIKKDKKQLFLNKLSDLNITEDDFLELQKIYN